MKIYDSSASSSLKRGGVYMVYEDPAITEIKIKNHSPILCKTRPYLIMTDMNAVPDVITCVQAFPLTHNIDESPYSPTDIVLTAPDGVLSRVATNQLTTIAIANIRQHLFDVESPAVMNELQKITIKLLGLAATNMKKVAKPIGTVEMGSPVLTPVKIKNEEMDQQPKEKEPSEPKPATEPKPRRKHIKWTDDICRQFIYDMDHMAPAAVSEKWGLQKSGLYKQVQICKKKLGL